MYKKLECKGELHVDSGASSNGKSSHFLGSPFCPKMAQFLANHFSLVWGCLLFRKNQEDPHNPTELKFASGIGFLPRPHFPL